jgi:RNA polymerase sigma factor (sigma-70 family)
MPPSPLPAGNQTGGRASYLVVFVVCMEMGTEFERVVELHYPALYRFALSLTHQESDACDLTQQTFYIWARKGDQLQDRAKIKSWLFTTMHREYLQHRRKFSKRSHVTLSDAEHELPHVAPRTGHKADAATVLQALARLDQLFQAPIALFYLEEYSYQEIGAILEIPLGTVKSRISRGIAQLQDLLEAPGCAVASMEAHD